MKVKNTFAALLCLAACAACTPQKKYVSCDGAMIGTTFHVCAELCGVPSSRVYAGMMHLDSAARASMSVFDEGSLLNRINRNETDVPDEHLLRNFAVADAVWAVSGGRYDITVKPLAEAWGFAAREADAEPDTDSLLVFVGRDKWRMENGRIVKSDPRVQFDLNSIAKGYTVDLAAAMLDSLGSENYIVEIGGEVRCRGVNPSGESWRIGIDSPFEGNMSPGASMCGTVRLRDRSLATSGNYRRFHVDAGGRKRVHTIDPRTGCGAVSRLLSATVAAPSCMLADALATMFMAAGADDALSLARAMRDTVQVFFVLAPEGDADAEYEIFSTMEE